MKKESIFDLWEEQHKDDPKAPERVENEVQPQDLEEEKEVTKQPEPEQKQDPEPAAPEPEKEPEKGEEHGIS